MLALAFTKDSCHQQELLHNLFTLQGIQISQGVQIFSWI